MRYKSKQALLDDIRTELKRSLKGTAGADVSGARPSKRSPSPKAHAGAAQQRATPPPAMSRRTVAPDPAHAPVRETRQ